MWILKILFEQFVQTGLYLRGWSQKTPAIYHRAFTGFQRSGASMVAATTFAAWVTGERKRGLSASCCNIYIRAMNAFASWLQEEGHVADRIRLKQLKTHRKPVKCRRQSRFELLKVPPKRLTYGNCS